MEFTVTLPPGKVRGRTNWDEIVELLQRNRGQWGNVGVFSIAQASQIRAGNVSAFLPRKGMEPEEKREWMRLNYEVQYRIEEGHEPNRADIYIRYIG